jgi:hypothetical protein
MAFVMAAIGTAGVGAVAGLGGAVISSNAAKDAAQTQADAANRASDLQYQEYQQQRTDNAPWRQAGADALSGLSNPYFQQNFSMSDFNQDPGYQFRMQQGQQALERSAAARGGLGGGAEGKALTRYGQDYASGEYQNAYNRFTNDQSNRFNRLSSIAGLGQTANAQIGQAGQNYANNVGNNYMGAANAQGAAGVASANAYGNALSGFGNNLSSLGTLSWLQRTKQSYGDNGPPLTYDNGGL